MIDGLDKRFKELIAEICERNDFVLLALETDKDHCHLFVNVPPDISAADVMRIVKANTAKVLMEEFPQLSKARQVWTRSYFASTAGDVSSETIQKYIAAQRTR